MHTYFSPIIFAFSFLELQARLLFIAILVGLAGCSEVPPAPQKFKLGASVYAGWMPWMLASEDGSLKKASLKRNIDISLVRGDYVESINQFMSGHLDAVVMTNIDALRLLPGSGIEADVILIGSYSNGNDAILTRQPQTALVQGDEIGLVENSVSQYLLDRYLEKNALPPITIKTRNVSDAEILRTFAASASSVAGVAGVAGVATRAPMTIDIELRLGGKRLVDSAAFPKEIADILMVRREVLQQHPEFAQALLETWFGVVKNLNGAKRAATIADLARLSGGTIEEYEAQLKTTILIDTKEKALKEMGSAELAQTALKIEKFVRSRAIIKNPPPTPWQSQGSYTKAALHFNLSALNNLSMLP